MPRKSDTGPFSIIPEWVLDTDVSHVAIRLYCALARYADDETTECWPARRTLWTRLRCSERTLDKAVKELAGVGAIRVEHRHTETGDLTSNRYYVLRIAPSGAAGCATPGAGPAVENENHLEREPKNDTTAPSSAGDLTREGPSTDAWAIAKKARERGDLIVHRVDRVARDVQKLLDTGAPVEDLAGAVESIEAGMTVTLGTLGVGMSKYRLARTREREAAERGEQRPTDDFPYVTSMGGGNNQRGGVDSSFYDRMAEHDRRRAEGDA